MHTILYSGIIVLHYYIHNQICICHMHPPFITEAFNLVANIHVQLLKQLDKLSGYAQCFSIFTYVAN